MEELLNKLIEKGWYPFCDSRVYQIKIYSDMDIECIYGKRKSDFYYTSYRKLASKESGLWQFVCKNGIAGRGDRITKRKKVKDTDSRSGEEVIYYSVIGSYNETDYEYRLIESSLKDESELEDFLLENIKIS